MEVKMDMSKRGKKKRKRGMENKMEGKKKEMKKKKHPSLPPIRRYAAGQYALSPFLFFPFFPPCNQILELGLSLLLFPFLHPHKLPQKPPHVQYPTTLHNNIDVVQVDILNHSVPLVGSSLFASVQKLQVHVFTFCRGQLMCS